MIIRFAAKTPSRQSLRLKMAAISCNGVMIFRGFFYPGHWGCFGGAVNPGEDDIGALRRELAEELEMPASATKEFVRFDFDLRKLEQKQCYRTYYEFKVSAAEVSRFVLHEGAEMKLMAPTELFGARVTPYDSFALWPHFSRNRFA